MAFYQGVKSRDGVQYSSPCGGTLLVGVESSAVAFLGTTSLGWTEI